MKGRSLKIVVAAMFLTGMLVSSSMADYLSAKVMRTASTDAGVVSIMMQFVSGKAGECTWPNANATCSACWFAPSGTGMDDQTLAVSLTAISLDMNVRVNVDTCPGDGVGNDGTFSHIGLDLL